jgi:hypothetical protein
LAPDAPRGTAAARLAEWVAHPANPLTARVIVNRVWHYHFGTGLVATPNDLGRNGDRPSHPELLDWLAADFLRHGTRLKTLHRRIMLSNTYRRSSRFDAKAAAIDADDRLLWRYPARRLEAEAIRDAMLHASGQIDIRMAGPSFRPFTVTVFGSNFYQLTDPVGPEFNRRTISPRAGKPSAAVTGGMIRAAASTSSSPVSLQYASRAPRSASGSPTVLISQSSTATISPGLVGCRTVLSRR